MASNLTLTSPTYDTTSEEFGSAALSGGYGIATLAAAPSLPFTAECWFKAPAAPGAVKGIGGQNTMLQMRITAIGGLQLSGFSGTTTPAADSVNHCDGNWHHIAAVMTSSGVFGYVDGVQVLAYTGTPTFTSSTSWGVRDFAGNTGFAFGEVDEFALWPIAKYTGNFTPPTSAYTGTEGMNNLWHLDSTGADSATPAPVVIAPNSAAILYSPHNWAVSAAVAKCNNTGAYFSMGFTGTSCQLNFDAAAASGNPQGWYRIDGYGPWTRFTAVGNVTCSLPGDTSAQAHHLLEVVFKSQPQTGSTAWNTQQVAFYLNGITLGAGQSAFAPAAPTKKIVDIFGDSITQGVTNVNNTDGTNQNQEDAKMAWPFLLRDRLGADVAPVGWGGQGWIRPPGAAAGSTTVTDLPAFPASWNSLWSGQPRDWTTPPDLVVINHGTNDTSYTASQITAAVTSTLQAMIAAGATKIAVMRPFGGSSFNPDSMVWPAIKAGIAAVGSSNIYQIDTTGWFNTANSVDGLHPLGLESLTSLADKLANALRPILYGPAQSTVVGAVADSDTVTLMRSGSAVQVAASALKSYLKAA